MRTLLLCAALATNASAKSEWQKAIDAARKEAQDTISDVKNTADSGKAAILSVDEIAGGLREALSRGVSKAVANLGRPDGFLKALDVHIPIPEKLKSAEHIAHKLGMGKTADKFEATLNRAAEAAVPEAAAVFGEAVKKMTLADARNILHGSDDAATQYFRKACGDTLLQKFSPIVHDATQKVGVTRSYEDFRKKTGPFLSLTTGTPPDLDAYVTGKAMDALFLRVAAEEREIRKNPAARATDLLKKVFGSLTR